MKRGLRLFFDECVSPKLMGSLTDYLKRIGISVIETEHIRDILGHGTKDPVWLKKLSDDNVPPWLAITGDSGKHSRGELLRFAKEYDVTHITFSPKLHRSSIAVKFAALSQTGVNLPLLHRLPPGTHVKLVTESLSGGIIRYNFKVGTRSLSATLGKPTERRLPASPPSVDGEEPRLF